MARNLWDQGPISAAPVWPLLPPMRRPWHPSSGNMAQGSVRPLLFLWLGRMAANGIAQQHVKEGQDIEVA